MHARIGLYREPSSRTDADFVKIVATGRHTAAAALVETPHNSVSRAAAQRSNTMPS
jgi:hypothetical protein